MREHMAPGAALADERFSVLRTDEGEALRTWLAEEGAAAELPDLPQGWQWASTNEPLLRAPQRCHVSADGTTSESDEKPNYKNLWDWIGAVEQTSWFSCQVLDTWTGDEESKSHTAEPSAPDCHDRHEHNWRSPIEIVGGIKENPGVWSHGGGGLATSSLSRSQEIQSSPFQLLRSPLGNRFKLFPDRAKCPVLTSEPEPPPHRGRLRLFCRLSLSIAPTRRISRHGRRFPALRTGGDLDFGLGLHLQPDQAPQSDRRLLDSDDADLFARRDRVTCGLSLLPQNRYEGHSFRLFIEGQLHFRLESLVQYFAAH